MLDDLKPYSPEAPKCFQNFNTVELQDYIGYRPRVLGYQRASGLFVAEAAFACLSPEACLSQGRGGSENRGSINHQSVVDDLDFQHFSPKSVLTL